jgi:hypothetical protein
MASPYARSCCSYRALRYCVDKMGDEVEGRKDKKILKPFVGFRVFHGIAPLNCECAYNFLDSATEFELNDSVAKPIESLILFDCHHGSFLQ